ncbi:MAG: Phage terminase large subunit [Firmicutes bacterium ADurb.Bin193]|nr:MAG: Phage terminase large subunit [Firmicutes bacterium ADurb.Bin193]
MSLQASEKEIAVNDVYIPLIECRSRKLVLYGGSGSGKSVFAAHKIVLRTVTEQGHTFLCLRKVAETVKESIFAELKAMIEEMGCFDEFKINLTEKTFLHIPTGNRIICKGLDEPEKIKSIKGITGMWIEEATEFTEDDLFQLDLRIRGEKPHYVQYIYSFNPISEDNTTVKRFIINKDKEIDCTVVHTTHLDNYFLSDADRKILLDLKDKNPIFYDVYCLGIPGVVDKSNKFLYSFNAEKQVKKVILDRNLPIWITFDFNIDPMTVTIGQRPHLTKLICKQCIQLDNSDIYAMCDRIRADYPDWNLIVTGDASGHNRTGAVRGKTSYWQVIKYELSLKDLQMKVRGNNIGLIESRVLCNAVNQAVEIEFDEEGCKPLINECKFAQVDDHGVLIKDRKKQKNDFLDGFRYLVDANFYDFLGKQHKYVKG